MASLRIRLENWLGRRAPRLYLRLRDIVRHWKRRRGRPSYAEARKDYNDYREVLRLGRANLPADAAVIDVGAGETSVIGERVIISMPYRWRAGACPGHVQDPVDEEKLRAWTGRDPAETLIVKDGLERLIPGYPAAETTSAQP